MAFEGLINADCGGFLSVRAQVSPEAFADMTTIKFRVKSDGQDGPIQLGVAQMSACKFED